MDKDCTETGDNSTFSYFEYDDGPYFDIDFTAPSHGTASPLEDNKRKPYEFQFSIPKSAKEKQPHHHESERVDDVSPADALFYKGQLLPLHLPPRLQMMRNLSESGEFAVDNKYVSPGSTSGGLVTTNEDFYILFSSGSDDSEQGPISCKEIEFSSAKTDNTHLHSTVEPATKCKSGPRKFSKVGTDRHFSAKSSPPPQHPPPLKNSRFTIKLKTLQFFGKNYRAKSQKSPQPYSSWSTSAIRVLHKCFKMAKHILSESHYYSADNHQLEVGDECAWWPCIVGESGRRNHISLSSKLKKGSSCPRSCPPPMNSPPNHNGVLARFCNDDLESSIAAAIAYCKHSNGVTDSYSSKDFECPSQRFTSSQLITTPDTEGAQDFH